MMGSYSKMSIDEERKKHTQLIQLVRDTIQQDVSLREKYEVGDKFRFVRDRLNTLLSDLETHALAAKTTEQAVTSQEASNEALVYVYLYNAQGAVLRSWVTMLTPKVFYEYSVNRPIYADKTAIENVLRAKSSRQQHAYLTIAVDRASILPSNTKDTAGNPTIKVKEGALNFKKLVAFTYNNDDYVLDARGELIKKS